MNTDTRTQTIFPIVHYLLFAKLRIEEQQDIIFLLFRALFSVLIYCCVLSLNIMTNAASVITGAFRGTCRVNLYHEVGHASLKSVSWCRYLCTVLDPMLFFTRFCKTFDLLVRQPKNIMTYLKGTNRCQRKDCSNKDRENSYILT